MGFKKLSTKIENQEEKFVNSARGETSDIQIDEEKRDKTVLLYFTQNEIERINKEAKSMGMKRTVYIRHKLFN